MIERKTGCGVINYMLYHSIIALNIFFREVQLLALFPYMYIGIVKQDVVVPIPYPGSTPDFAGLVEVTKKIHGASPDFNMAIRDSIVDDTDSKVVLKLNCTGTQTGYVWFCSIFC